MYVTESEAKKPESEPEPEAGPDPQSTERPKVNYENPAPGEPIRPSPMMKRAVY
jgi:hypothetical protein